MRQPRIIDTWLVSLSILLPGMGGCVGVAEDAQRTDPGRPEPSANPSPTPEPTGPGLPVLACKTPGSRAGDAPVRRLTRVEYNNTVTALLGDKTNPSGDFVADDQPGGFENNAGSPVMALVAAQYAEAAETLSRWAVTTSMSALLPCAATAQAGTAHDDACAAQFVRDFGKRAYRRPLTDLEAERLVGLYKTARTTLGVGFNDGIRIVLQTMLQSTHFLNHLEAGVTAAAKDGLVPLSPYETASRLSYYLWSSMPDTALFAAADAGKLATAADLEAQAERMLADPKAKAGVLSFFQQWLELEKLNGIDKSKTVLANWKVNIRKFLRPEAEAFVNHVMWEADAKLTSMFTAPYGFVNSALAPLYGVPDPGMGDTLVKTPLDPTQRAGMLTSLTTLSIRSYLDATSPVHRGLYVRERLMCQPMPSPPPGVDVTLPPLDPKMTTRERFAKHSSDPYCGGCHALMDPIGLGFESYDAVGRFRTKEAGKDLDDTGSIVGSSDLDGAFKGAIALSEKLSKSVQARDCFAGQWLEYASGGPTTDLGCAVSQLGGVLAGGDIKKLIVAVAKSEPFRFRRTLHTGVCQ